MGVRVAPGETVLTLIPPGPNSAAQLRGELRLGRFGGRVETDERVTDLRHPRADNHDPATPTIEHRRCQRRGEQVRSANVDREGRFEIGVAQAQGVDRGTNGGVVDDRVQVPARCFAGGLCERPQLVRRRGQVGRHEHGSAVSLFDLGDNSLTAP